ncbi:MAG: hypothetical protein RLZZ338_4240 [Cyanobacteriota bacterium]|jgi:hypothetical protein
MLLIVLLTTEIELHMVEMWELPIFKSNIIIREHLRWLNLSKINVINKPEDDAIALFFWYYRQNLGTVKTKETGFLRI